MNWDTSNGMLCKLGHCELEYSVNMDTVNGNLCKIGTLRSKYTVNKNVRLDVKVVQVVE